MRTSLRSGIAAGFILIVASACGGSGAATAAPPAASAAVPSAAAAAPTCASGIGTGQQVAAAGTAFTPPTSSVSKGGTVSWTNGDPVAHTVTFNDGPDCGNLAPAASITVTFPGPGTYAYHCKIHPSMTGTVTVS